MSDTSTKTIQPVGQNAQIVELNTISKATQKMVAMPGQAFKVMVDGQLYVGQKSINGRQLRLLKKGDALILAVDAVDAPLLEVSGYFADASESAKTLTTSELNVEVLEPQAVFADGGAVQIPSADVAGGAGVATPSWGTLVTQTVGGTVGSSAALSTTAAAAPASAGAAVAAFVAAVAVVATIDSDKPVTSQTLINGRITAGPLIHSHELSVDFYQADGVTLIVGQVPVGRDGYFSVSVGEYTGVVIARVVDSGGGDDYTDEATGADIDLSAVLMAVGYVDGGTLTLNISPLTAIAAQIAGLNPDGSGMVSGPDVIATVDEANTRVANAFGLADITSSEPNLTNDSVAGSNPIGKVLAALSGMDSTGSTQNTIDTLADAIAGTGVTASLSGSSQVALLQGAAAVVSLTPQERADLVLAVSELLTIPQGQQIGPDELDGIDVATFAALSPTFIGRLEAQVITSLPDALLQAMTSAQVMQLQSSAIDSVPASVIDDLSAAQVAALSNAQLSSLTSEQAAAIAVAGGFADLRPTQVAQLQSSAIDSVPDSVLQGLSATEVAALSAPQLAAFSDAQVALLDLSEIDGTQAEAMAQAGNLDNLSASQIQSLLPEAIDSVPDAMIATLTGPEVAALSDAQVAALTASQLQALNTAGLLDNLAHPLRQDQLSAMSSNGIDTAGESDLMNDVLAQALDSTSSIALAPLFTAVQAVQAQAAGTPGLTMAHLTDLGITGPSGVALNTLTPAQQNAILAAIAAAANDGSGTATLADLQTRVANAATAMATIASAANGATANGAAPELQDYQAIGVTLGSTLALDSDIDSQQNTLTLFNDIVMGLDSADVDTVGKISDLAATVNQLAAIAALDTGATIDTALKPTLDDLRALGLTLDNATNVDAILAELANSANSLGDVLSLSQLAALIASEAPTASSATLTILEDEPRSFSAGDFGFADAADTPAHSLSSVIITGLPSVGSLKLNNVDVQINDSIAVADLSSLVYTPLANTSGSGFATINFKVRDSGGTLNNGQDTSSNAYTLTFDVTAVNDAPSINAGHLQLTGGTDKVTTTIGTELEMSQASFTLESWIMTTASSQAIVSKVDNDGTWEAGEKSFYLDNAGRPTFVGFGYGFIKSLVSVNDGQRHHVAVAWDNTQSAGKIYVDGVDQTDIANTNYKAFAGFSDNNTDPVDASIQIGLKNNATVGDNEAYNNFTGLIGDLRLWTTARSALEIASNKNTLVDATTPGLLANFRLDSAPAGTVTSTNGTFHGTLAGNAAMRAGMALATIAEDTTNPAGVSVHALVGLYFADIDTDAAFGGVAVVANTADSSTQGVWQYSTNAGTNWHALGAVNDSSDALALSASTLLRFVPASHYNGMPPSLMVRALDNTYVAGYSTAAATESRVTVATSANGNTAAVSGNTNTIGVSVSAVNDAPVLTDIDLFMAPVNEDTTTAPTGQVGVLVSSLMGGVSDADGANVAKGMAITGGPASGTLYYSTNDGTTWTNVATSGAVSATNALLLSADATTRLHYAPAANFSGSFGTVLTFRAWDGTTGTAGTKVNPGTTGGTSSFSNATDTVAITVTNINDAPVLTDTVRTLGTIDINLPMPTGAVGSLVSQLTGSGVSDVDTLDGRGIAITAVNTTNGTLYFSTNGGTAWTDITAAGPISASSALLLVSNSQTRLYFQPNSGYSGTTNDVLTFRAWDASQGTAGQRFDITATGTTTAFSTASDTVAATVQSINDAGILALGGNAIEDGTLTASVTDADGVDVNAITYTWEASTTGVSAWSTISGATGSSLQTGQAQVGQFIRVRVSYTDQGGATEVITSQPTGQRVDNVNDPLTGSVTLSQTTGLVQGGTLSAVTSTLADEDGLGGFAYQWQSSANNGANWNDIVGANGVSYSLGNEVANQRVRVVVAYQDAYGNLHSAASPMSTDAVQNLNDAPTGTIGYTLSGPLKQGATLTATSTLRDPDGPQDLFLTYQWQSSGDGNTGWTNIDAATTAQYTLQAADVGQFIRLQASYSDSLSNSTTVYSAVSTASVASLNATPTGSVMLTGTAQQGTPLSVSHTLADADNLGTISYEWQSSVSGANDDWSAIPGATGSSFSPLQAQVGRYIRVVARYTDGGGTVEAVTSNVTPSKVVNVDDVGSLSLSGAALQNGKLTVNLIDIDGVQGSPSYSWFSSQDGQSWTAIADAGTTNSLTLAQAQVGRFVGVTATYTDSFGITATTSRVQTSVAVANVNDIGTIAITGTRQVGQALDAGTVSDADGNPASVSYQWQRYNSGTGQYDDIASNGTAAQYTATGDDAGKTLRLKASYTDALGTLETIYSAPTIAVAAASGDPAALAALANAAQANNASVSNADVAVFSNAAVINVNTDNLDKIHSVLNSDGQTGEQVDTSLKLQAVVDAVNAVMAAADGTNNDAVISVAHIASLGLDSVLDTAPKRALFADLLDNFTPQSFMAANPGVSDFHTLLAQLADAVAGVVAQTSANPSSPVTLAQLQRLGLSNVTADNLDQVRTLLGNTTDGGSGISTLASLNTVVGAALPVLVSSHISTDGSTLVLNFSEALSGALDAGTFTVTVAGQTVTPYAVALDGAQLRLSFSGSIAGAQVPVVSYIPPGSNPLQDNTGHSLLAFTTGQSGVAAVQDAVVRVAFATDSTITFDSEAQTLRANLTEGDSGNTVVPITVQRSANAGGATTTVGYSIIAGSAGAADVLITSGTISISGSDTSATVPVTLIGDTLAEGIETFRVVLTSASTTGLTSALSSTHDDISVRLLDNDAVSYYFDTAQVSNGVSFTEDDNASQTVSVTVYRSQSGTAAQLSYGINARTANGEDVQLDTLSVSFAAGEVSKTLPITLRGDLVPESSETFAVRLLTVTAASGNHVIADAANVLEATIVDNDAVLYSLDHALVSSGLNVNEGDSGSQTVQFTVTRNDASETGSVSYVVRGSGRAVNADDASLGTGTVTFAVGQLTATIAVQIRGDTVAEPSEAMTVGIVSAQNGGTRPARIDSANASILVAVIDNDTTQYRIFSVATEVMESDDSAMEFTVLREGNIDAAGVVQFTLNSAMTTPGGDFVNAITGSGVSYNPLTRTGSVSFAAGQSQTALRIALQDDNTLEVGEYLEVVLTGVSTGGGFVATPAASQTLIDDDHTRWNLFAGETTTEGATATFTITRSGDTSAAATITVRGDVGTATSGSHNAGNWSAGADYDGAERQIVFAAGQTSASFSVLTRDDSLNEGTESLRFTITDVAATGQHVVATPSATLNLRDTEQTHWSVSTGDTFTAESGSLVFTVNRTGATDHAAVLRLRTEGGTATPGADYQLADQLLSFAAGETSKTVLVHLQDDNLQEIQETLGATLSLVSSASQSAVDVVLTPRALVSILDDDQSVWIVNASNSYEGADGLTYARFTVGRTGQTDNAATIRFSTTGQGGGKTAVVVNDYTEVDSLLLSFAPGQINQTVLVRLTDDNLPEATLGLSGIIHDASTGSIQGPVATSSLFDNDGTVWTIAAAAAVESEGWAYFSVYRDGADLSRAESITFSTASGFARGGSYDSATGTWSAGADYERISGLVLNFAPGEVQKRVAVRINPDSELEHAMESVQGVISNASAGTIAEADATASIEDAGRSEFSIAVGENGSEDAGIVTFVVSRVGASAQNAAWVRVQNVGGSASPGTDYEAIDQVLQFAPGQTSATLRVQLIDNALLDGNRSITAGITGYSPGSTLVDYEAGHATATVLDNDQSVWSVASYSINGPDEGGWLFAQVARTGDLSAASIRVRTTSGGAIGGSYDAVTNTWSAGADYEALDTVLSFAAGQTSQLVRVRGRDDTANESNEEITFVIDQASQGTIATGRAVLNTVDPDTPKWLLVNETYRANESGGAMVFTVYRHGDNSVQDTVEFVPVPVGSDNFAKPGEDFVQTLQTLTFAPGESRKTLIVPLLGDNQVEIPQGIMAVLSNPSRGQLVTSISDQYILDSSPQSPQFMLYTLQNEVTDTDGRTVLRVFRQDAGDYSTASSVVLNITGGQGAVNGVDFIAPVSQLIEFAPGETTKLVPIDLLTDPGADAPERITATLSDPATGNIFGAGSVLVTLYDSDTMTWALSAASGFVLESAGVASFTVSRNGNLAAAEVDVVLGGGLQGYQLGLTPGQGDAYLSPTGVQRLVFAEGQRTQTVTVQITNDAEMERAENISLTLANPSLGSLGAAAAATRIDDDDSSVWFIGSLYTLQESAGYWAVRVSRTASADMSPAVLRLFTGGGKATAGTWSEADGWSAGADYEAVDRLLTFAEGETTKNVLIRVRPDTRFENDDFMANIALESGTGTLGNISARAQVFEGALAQWSLTDTGDVDEQDGYVGLLVKRTGDNLEATSIELRFASDSATPGTYDAVNNTWSAGADYDGSSRTLNFAAGETSKTVLVRVNPDSVADGFESLTAYLTNPGAGNLNDPTEQVVIREATLPLWSIATINNDGTSEGTPASFVITRTGSGVDEAVIRFVTRDNSATANNGDYVAVDRLLTFAPGVTSLSVLVDTLVDNAFEVNESFLGSIGLVSGLGNIGTGSATMALQSNEVGARWRVGLSINEYTNMNEDTGWAVVVVQRMGDYSQAASVRVYTGAGTAVGGTYDVNTGTWSAGADFEAMDQVLSFAAGEAAKTVRIRLRDDAVHEMAEALTVGIEHVSGVNHVVEPGLGHATVTLSGQEGAANTTWSVAPTGAPFEMEGELLFTVARSGDISRAAVIDFATGSGTLSVGSDYQPVVQTLTFAAGQERRTVAVPLLPDQILEGNEQIFAVIDKPRLLDNQGNPTTELAGLIGGTAYSTFVRDSSAPSSWSLSPVSPTPYSEDGVAPILVSRSGSLAATRVRVMTLGGEATAGGDYQPVDTWLSFAEGQTSAVVMVPLIGDAVVERNSSFHFMLVEDERGLANTIGRAAVSLTDDDTGADYWSVLAQQSTIDEDSGWAVFRVQRAGEGANAAVVRFATTSDPGARSGSWSEGAGWSANADYEATDLLLSFAPGEMERYVRVRLNPDTVREEVEGVVGVISLPQGGGFISAASATVSLAVSEQSAWAINAVNANVGEGTGWAHFYVNRNIAGSDLPEATVRVYTTGGRPRGGSYDEGTGLWSAPDADYALLDTVLTFAAGENFRLVSVRIRDDAQAELNETLRVGLADPSFGRLNSDSATLTIYDDDQVLWTLNAQVSPSSFETAGWTVFSVSRTGGIDQEATIRFSTLSAGEVQGTYTDGVWSSNAEYEAVDRVLTFAAGETIKYIPIRLRNDDVLEFQSSLSAQLSDPSVGSISSGAVQTIYIQDEAQILWGANPTVSVVNESAGQAFFNVSRAGGAQTAAQLEVLFISNSEQPGEEYQVVQRQTLSFAVGEMNKVVSINLIDDQLVEADGNIRVVVINPTVGSIFSPDGVLTVRDNDGMEWALTSINPSDIVDDLAGWASFVVRRTGNLDSVATIDFATGGTGSLLGGSYSEIDGWQAGAVYESTFRTLTFAQGEGFKVLRVRLNPDMDLETSTATVGAVIGNASAGHVRVSAATRTLEDLSDPWVTRFTVGSAATTVQEHDGRLVYIIQRFGDLSQEDTVSYYTTSATTAGLASQAPTVLTFAVGEAYKAVSLVLNDNTDVASATQQVVLGLQAPSRGIISTATATTTVADNEAVAAAASYTLQGVGGMTSVWEDADYMVYRVSRNVGVDTPSTSYFRTDQTGVNNAASAGVYDSVNNVWTTPGDFEGTTLTLNWGEGELYKTVAVRLFNDDLAEVTENLRVQHAADSGFTTGLVSTTTTVLDDDSGAAATAYTIGNVSGTLNERAGYAGFTITRTGDVSQAGTSYFRTGTGTATAGSDYEAVSSQTLNWVAGEALKTVLVKLLDDSTAEQHETLIGQVAATADFAGAVSVTMNIMSDDVHNFSGTLSMGTYYNLLGSSGVDTLTVNSTPLAWSRLDMAGGNDVMVLDNAARLVSGAQLVGGDGLDTLRLNAAGTYNVASTNTHTGTLLQGFEVLDLGTGNQTVNLSLFDVLQMTDANVVPNLLRITGTAGDVVNLLGLGAPVSTPDAGTTVTDVDGTTTANVVAHASGQASANDVTLGAATYDVLQYQHMGETVTLLVQNTLTYNVI